MNIEEKAFKAQEFLNALKKQVFADERFIRVFTVEGNLQDDIQKSITRLNTTLKIYKESREKTELFPMDPFSKGEYINATLGLETALSNYEKLSIGTLLPTLKQKLIELPDKIDKGNIKLDQLAPLESTIEKPPPKFKVKPDVTVPVNPLGDKRVNAVNEKINRALEWIEIPLKIGKGVGEFLSEHGSTIVSAVSGVLKLLAII